MFKRYENGLTVIVEEYTGIRSVTSGIMVGAGSAYETAENNGISHFIEHMQFKGTAARSAEDIVRGFDEAGAAYNAFTGKEYTCFYFKTIDEKLEHCFDILTDIFLHSEYDPTELDRERKVILEEINMSLDEPDGVCYDVLYKLMFKGSLGLEILGTKDNVSRFTRDDIAEYKRAHYLPSNTVVAFVGNIKPDTAYALVEKYMGELIDAQETPITPSVERQSFNAGFDAYIHDYEQSELSVGYESPSLGDDRAITVSALDCILGNGMSSRLFQRIREKMGLCYSVYTSPWLGRNNGVFSVCANVNSVNAEQCLAAIRDEIERLTEKGVTDEETQKAKMQLKVNTLFGKENPMNYMLALMRRRLMLGEQYDVDEIIARVEEFSSKKITALARDIFGGKAAIAYAGKKTAGALDKIF